MPMTVSGLSSNGSATATITTSRTNYSNGTADRSGTASTETLVAPTFGTNTPTADGFYGLINNYSVNNSYNFATTSGSISVGAPPSSGSQYIFTVTGAPASTLITVTVNVSRTNYTGNSATTSATSLAPVVTPNISSIVARNGGTGAAYKMQYTFTATNMASYSFLLEYGNTTSLGSSVSTTTGSGNPLQSNSGNTAGASGSYYKLTITPYSGASQTGTIGTARVTRIKQNVATASTLTDNY